MREKEVFDELIIESREHLRAIEPDLLALEQLDGGDPEELIGHIFRAIHSIKGGFSFFGIEPVVRLAHAMENVLCEIRDRKLALSPACTDALLRGVDKLAVLMDDIGHAELQAVEEELRLLEPFLGEEPGGPSPAPSAAASRPELVADVPAQLIDAALADGKRLYQIRLAADAALREQLAAGQEPFTAWKLYGDILAMQPPPQQFVQQAAVAPPGLTELTLIYATVLEADLLATALGISAAQILPIELPQLQARRESRKSGILAEAARHRGGEPSPAPAGAGSQTRLDDSLRVKLRLLDSLMNGAGELVLARNQLLQVINRRCGDFPDAQKQIQLALQTVREAITGLRRSSPGQVRPEEWEGLVQQIGKAVTDAFGFPLRQLHGLAGIVQNLDLVTTQLQEGIMHTRMQPLAVVFGKFPRVIRDLSRRLGKQISLTQTGQEVELDRSIIEQLSDPLNHLVRNSADHGIEEPRRRLQSGKRTEGTICLRAFQEGGKVIIEVEDDGAGLDCEAIRQKAVQRGLLTAEASRQMTPRQLQMLIFTPGFSTSAAVSDISGRGIGMDVVKTNIERLGGTIDISSTTGSGTRIIMKLPLTLAIIPSLIITAAGRRFAMPQVSLEEIVRIRGGETGRRIERINTAEVLRLRGQLLPLVRLSEVLGIPCTFVHPRTGEKLAERRQWLSDRRQAAEPEHGEARAERRRDDGQDRRQRPTSSLKIIVLRQESRRFGLVVDEVLDSEEIVVKPLPDFLKRCPCYAGATIMGDGRVAMILDPNGIATAARLDFTALDKQIAAARQALPSVSRQLTDMLLFTVGGAERFAVALDEVARVEKRKPGEIQCIGEQEFISYEHHSLRLLRLERLLPLRSPAETAGSLFVIVPKNAPQPLGICASRLEDTVATELRLDTAALSGPGIAGSAIIGRKMTVVLDLAALMEAAAAQR